MPAALPDATMVRIAAAARLDKVLGPVLARDYLGGARARILPTPLMNVVNGGGLLVVAQWEAREGQADKVGEILNSFLPEAQSEELLP